MRVAILLAAGRSTRFGMFNKLLAPLEGRPLILHALAAARAAPVARVIAVVGHDHARVAAALRGSGPITVVRARAHRRGLSASLAAGLRAMRPAERDAFIFLGDMPRVPPFLAGRLLRARRLGDRAVRPAVDGEPGHPVLVRMDRALVAGLDGDRGLGELIRIKTRAVSATAGAFRDVDRRTKLPRGR